MGTRNNSQASIRPIYFKEKEEDEDKNQSQKEIISTKSAVTQINLKKNFKFKLQYSVHDLMSNDISKIAPNITHNALKNKGILRRLKQQNKVTSLDSLPIIRAAAKDSSNTALEADDQVIPIVSKLKDSTDVESEKDHCESNMHCKLNRRDSVGYSNNKTHANLRDSILISNQKDLLSEQIGESIDPKQHISRRNQRIAHYYSKSVIKQLMQKKLSNDIFTIYNDNCSSFKRLKQFQYRKLNVQNINE